jgi:hypothetical protein
VLAASIIRAASTSDMSVNFYQTTWCNNPEDSHFHTRHHENLKAHQGRACVSVWQKSSGSLQSYFITHVFTASDVLGFDSLNL